MKAKKIILWLSLFFIALVALALVAIPVFLIKPFSPQTERDLAVSFALKSWSPVVTIILAIVALIITVSIWRNSKRWYGKIFLIIPIAILTISVWFARQNHFEWMFNPIANSTYAKANEVNFVDKDDMVLAVEINGESVAYPVRQMAYHHIVADTVGGVPIAATY
jgi:Protein of unknown function (DUF3179)